MCKAHTALRPTPAPRGATSRAAHKIATDARSCLKRARVRALDDVRAERRAPTSTPPRTRREDAHRSHDRGQSGSSRRRRRECVHTPRARGYPDCRLRPWPSMRATPIASGHRSAHEDAHRSRARRPPRSWHRRACERTRQRSARRRRSSRRAFDARIDPTQPQRHCKRTPRHERHLPFSRDRVSSAPSRRAVARNLVFASNVGMHGASFEPVLPSPPACSRPVARVVPFLRVAVLARAPRVRTPLPAPRGDFRYARTFVAIHVQMMRAGARAVVASFLLVETIRLVGGGRCLDEP